MRCVVIFILWKLVGVVWCIHPLVLHMIQTALMLFLISPSLRMPGTSSNSSAQVNGSLITFILLLKRSIHFGNFSSAYYLLLLIDPSTLPRKFQFLLLYWDETVDVSFHGIVSALQHAVLLAHPSSDLDRYIFTDSSGGF
jgi:hypothetical protein